MSTRLLPLACATVALVALLHMLLAGHPIQTHLVNADALYLPVLFDDVLARGGRFADWYLTPAPYFFPDFPVYFLAWLPGGDVLHQTTLFAVFQTILTGATLLLLARQALPHHQVLAAVLLTISFIWLGLRIDDPFGRLFTSAYHYGAFLASILLVSLWLDLDLDTAEHASRRVMAAIIATVYMATLSDALFFIQAVVPLLGTVLICGNGARFAFPWRAVFLLVLPSLTAIASYGFLVPHAARIQTRLGWHQLPSKLQAMADICVNLFGGRPLLAALLLLSLLLGMFCMMAALRSRPVAWLPRPLTVLAVFGTLCCASTVAVLLLDRDLVPVPRYLIGAVSWPLVTLLFVIGHLTGTHFRHAGMAVCLLFTGLLAEQAWRHAEVRDPGRYFYPEQIRCIDRALAAANARHGIAEYWDAKRLQALSRENLTLAQYTPELQPMTWITSQGFYASAYDFAVMTKQGEQQSSLSRERLTAINGEPAQTVHCGDRTLLIYGRGKLRAAPVVPIGR